MSLESKIDDLIEALERNTKAQIVGKEVKSDAPAERSPRSRSDKDDPKKEEPAERGSRRSRGDDKTKDEPAKGKDEPAKGKDGPTEGELKERVAKFLDLPSTKEGDEEYEKRLNKVIDPIFERAGVKEIPDLPEKYWQDVLDSIADYEKAAGGGSRRHR